MADILALNQALGEAYALHHAQDRPAAVELLRAASADPEFRALAEQKRRDLAAVVKARSLGGRCGCTLSETTHSLIAEALDA